jgi:putative ABC transport system permease protein
LMRLDISEGRYFTPGEEQGGLDVAVIGWDIKDELFGPLDPVGRELLVGAGSYRVIGVVAEQGRTLGQSQDDQLWMPIASYRRAFGNRTSINLVVKARDGVPGLEASIDEVRALLRALRHTAWKDPDPFGIVTLDRLQTLWRQISERASATSGASSCWRRPFSRWEGAWRASCWGRSRPGASRASSPSRPG